MLEIMQIILLLLLDPREVRFKLLLGFYVFHFLFVLVHFVFCYLNLITIFPCLIKYYHIMFINIVPPGGSGWTIGVY